MVTLECVQKLYIPVACKTETGLIVCQYTLRRTQYDRLSQQQLSFLLSLHAIASRDRILKAVQFVRNRKPTNR